MSFKGDTRVDGRRAEVIIEAARLNVAAARRRIGAVLQAVADD